MAIWTSLATKGDADAQFNLGQAYRLGRGVAINLAAAKDWFEKSADQGHIDAETTLGLLLFQGGEQSDGLKWLKKAAVQGEPRALLMYGTALVNGDSVTQDPVLGYAYVSRAAAQGLQPAKVTLTQLDQILPLADRKRGLEIARTLAKAAPPPKSAQVPAEPTKPVETAAPKSMKPVETATTKLPKPTNTAAARPQPKAEATEKPETLTQTAKAPVKPKPMAAKTAPQPSGAWRIQLGAFSQKGRAEAMYRTVSHKSALAGRQPFYVAAGPVTRLQVGPFENKAAAEAACRSVGKACFPLTK